MEKFHQLTKINPNEHCIHLICKWQAHEHYQAVGILDNENTRATLEMSTVEHTIELLKAFDYLEGHGDSHVCSNWIMNQQTSCHRCIIRK